MKKILGFLVLAMLVGAARLVHAAQKAGAEIIIYDTSGLVNPAEGGANLKHAKIDLLRPSIVFAIQRDQELATLLAPLRHNRHMQVIELRPSPAAQPRDVPARQAHRASQFARYFAAARSLTLDWGQLAVFPSPRFAFNQLVALEDADGFTLSLGIVTLSNAATKQVQLLTPLDSPDGVEALRLGDLTLDPKTFRDQPLV